MDQQVSWIGSFEKKMGFKPERLAELTSAVPSVSVNRRYKVPFGRKSLIDSGGDSTDAEQA